MAIATKNYTSHHKIGYSLDVDDDFSKIAVILETNWPQYLTQQLRLNC